MARRWSQTPPTHHQEANNARLLRIREALERLGIGRSTLYLLMERGELAYVRIGADRRISEAAIAAYIERHTVEVA